jgi:hypothetical protein
MLRKTQSQPQPQGNIIKATTLPAAVSSSCTASSGSKKDSKADNPKRCQSVPHAAQAAVNSKEGVPSPSQDASVEKLKLENKKTAPPTLGGPSGSPKPKRTILEGFRNTLRPKSKSQETNKVNSSSSSSPSKSCEASSSYASATSQAQSSYSDSQQQECISSDTTNPGAKHTDSPNASADCSGDSAKLKASSGKQASCESSDETTSVSGH